MDSGFSMTSRVDKALAQGMNVPTHLRQCSKYEYILPNGDEYEEEKDGDCTFESTMIHNVQGFTLVSDMISIE